jgi:hypothetical protein
MLFLKRLFGVVFLLLSVTGVVLAVAGIAAIWVVRPTVTERADRAFGRVGNALDRARDTLGTINRILTQARSRLREVRARADQARGDVQQTSSFRNWAARLVTNELTPQVGNVGPTLQSLSDATVVANSILGDLQELPAGSLPFLDQDRLRQMDEKVTRLSATTRDLERTLGDPAGGTVADEEAARVEQVLAEVSALTEEYEGKVAEIDDRVRSLRAKVHSGLLWGAVAATALLAWFTLSQLALFRWGWSLLRRSSAAPSPAAKPLSPPTPAG